MSMATGGNGGNGGTSAGGSAGSDVGGATASAGSAGAAEGGAPPLPTRDEYLATLSGLCDRLISTQLAPPDPNAGALVSPSTNPTLNPIHSRAAEAVYPCAVAYEHSQDAKYSTAAVALGNWLVGIQTTGGSWIEEWPSASGWQATTADQLISLAGAYVLLESQLSPTENDAWVGAISKAADWVEANFPISNINYWPTGAVALVLATRAVPSPPASWLTKAQSLIESTVASINADNLITGEGSGVDLGYNMAQAIGFIAMYGKLLPSATYVDQAADLLKTHYYFMYPNGAIDNSWGTRSFKWMLESGTKTAPGIYFTFALLADKDPSIQRGAQLALAFLRDHFLDDQGWVMYGPHASGHSDSDPPDNYSTFARAQSIAMAIEYGPDATEVAAIPAENKNWFKFFPTVNTGVLRTDQVMATVTAYGAIATYGRESVTRGGSVSLLWFEGYGPTGFLQASSVSVYQRVEALHMPNEGALLPLTPRIETTSGTYYTNLFDDQTSLSMTDSGASITATASGSLKTVAGASSGTTFSFNYEFGPDFYSKEVQVSSPSGLRIVEPFVDNPGNAYALVGSDSFQITTETGGVWELKVVSSTGP
ncbi:MAG TPA: hypothetical protein VGP93_19300, partial [Polyangiaceae bacterium]|nr:hypothetical protein [Polyangiaceae bacterium]